MGSSVRVDNWSEIIDEELEKARFKTFKYGEFDCCLFVADIVEKMTGIDHAKAFRGQYKSKSKAMKLINNDIRSTLNDILGRESNTLESVRGDVLLLKNKQLAIHTGVFAVTTSDKGIRYTPAYEAVASWSIN